MSDPCSCGGFIDAGGVFVHAERCKEQIEITPYDEVRANVEHLRASVLQAEAAFSALLPTFDVDDPRMAEVARLSLAMRKALDCPAGRGIAKELSEARAEMRLLRVEVIAARHLQATLIKLHYGRMPEEMQRAVDAYDVARREAVESAKQLQQTDGHCEGPKCLEQECDCDCLGCYSENYCSHGVSFDDACSLCPNVKKFA